MKDVGVDEATGWSMFVEGGRSAVGGWDVDVGYAEGGICPNIEMTGTDEAATTFTADLTGGAAAAASFVVDAILERFDGGGLSLSSSLFPFSSFANDDPACPRYSSSSLSSFTSLTAFSTSSKKASKSSSMVFQHLLCLLNSNKNNCSGANRCLSVTLKIYRCLSVAPQIDHCSVVTRSFFSETVR